MIFIDNKLIYNFNDQCLKSNYQTHSIYYILKMLVLVTCRKTYLKCVIILLLYFYCILQEYKYFEGPDLCSTNSSQKTELNRVYIRKRREYYYGSNLITIYIHQRITLNKGMLGKPILLYPCHVFRPMSLYAT